MRNLQISTAGIIAILVIEIYNHCEDESFVSENIVASSGKKYIPRINASKTTKLILKKRLLKILDLKIDLLVLQLIA